jgi:hypothetical protein
MMKQVYLTLLARIKDFKKKLAVSCAQEDAALLALAQKRLEEKPKAISIGIHDL